MRALVPVALLALASTAVAQVDVEHNHLACYRVSMNGPTALRLVDVETEFGTRQTVVMRPVLLCAPAKKTGGPGPDPIAPTAVPFFTCYKIKAPRPQAAIRQVTDQFGTGSFTIGSGKLLCTPTAVGSTTTTVPPASTTSTTQAPGTTTSTTSSTTSSTIPQGSTTSITSTTIPVTTSSTSSSTTTSTIAAGCCGAERIRLSSTAGTLKVGGFQPFPFPSGVQTVIDAGTADATCRHPVTIPAGGFSVPAFCIPALQYTSELVPTGCESGTGIGAGLLWDGHAATHGGTPMTNVAKSADSADGVCDNTGGLCANRDNNLLGDIDKTITAGGDPTKIATALDIPAHSRTWQDAAGCPGNGVYNAGEGDVLVTEFDFVLSPTTGTATGVFADKNGDGCDLPAGSAGFGAASAQCSAGAKGPCSAVGLQAAGPCCTTGQATTVVTVGAAFSNSFPLYDLGFISAIPSTVQACDPVGADTCVVTTDPCKQ
jgi:hypothetical protein